MKNTQEYTAAIDLWCFRWLWKEPVVFWVPRFEVYYLTTKSIQGTSLAFQSIDHIHGSDCLPLGMFCVCDSITDDIFQEHLQYTSGLFIDQARDTFDTTSSCQTADCRLGDTLDIITQDLPVTLGTTLSQTFASFTTSRHVASRIAEWQLMAKPASTWHLYSFIPDPRANTCKNSTPVSTTLMILYQKIPDLLETTFNLLNQGKQQRWQSRSQRHRSCEFFDWPSELSMSRPVNLHFDPLFFFLIFEKEAVLPA